MVDYILKNPALLAALCTVFGGVLLKVTEKWLHTKEDKRNEAKDYRDTINELNTRLDKVEEEVSTWRQKAYDLEEEVTRLRVFIVNLGHEPPQRPTKTQ